MDSSMLPPSPPGALTGAARQNAINHAGLINKTAFEVNVGLFTGLAVLTIAVRFVVRLRQLRRLFLDDYLLLCSSACLLVALGLIYPNTSALFLGEATLAMPDKITVESMDEAKDLISLNNYSLIYLSIIWISTYSVKFSFLAVFKPLVWNKLSRSMMWYFWFVVAFTACSWAYSECASFIPCPHFGAAVIKCYNRDSHNVTITTMVTATVVDVITDIMVVSFPIIILHKANMGLAQKVGLGIFLALSLVMVLVAIVEMIGSIVSGINNLDLAWIMFWQHMHACTGIIMGSVSALRTIYSRREGTAAQKLESPPASDDGSLATPSTPRRSLI
ncbi:uncharacterized protein K452DRAFT_355198 [Aplosporella prunicola CBS 121167]|uniref:Rhodopsin domain-containing protein n=1 Tax=Aplosporella prunicola CBS 121167 TaxID=1176127 RepID=A0A6A6BVM4_9PEZI|nr:uncharacterized protein K452DRAFT_355198 [Aplosporella prunicola CBS 121167]KAF2146741.1 hypothetical protein K452DRAFT_355198 [Aplosporella prunicola CBS 121167]